MFWASQSLEADRMQQYKEDIKKLQTNYQDSLEDGSMTQNDFETQQHEITSTLLQESKRKTEQGLSLDSTLKRKAQDAEDEEALKKAKISKAELDTLLNPLPCSEALNNSSILSQTPPTSPRSSEASAVARGGAALWL